MWAMSRIWDGCFIKHLNSTKTLANGMSAVSRIWEGCFVEHLNSTETLANGMWVTWEIWDGCFIKHLTSTKTLANGMWAMSRIWDGCFIKHLNSTKTLADGMSAVSRIWEGCFVEHLNSTETLANGMCAMSRIWDICFIKHLNSTKTLADGMSAGWLIGRGCLKERWAIMEVWNVVAWLTNSPSLCQQLSSHARDLVGSLDEPDPNSLFLGRYRDEMLSPAGTDPGPGSSSWLQVLWVEQTSSRPQLPAAGCQRKTISSLWSRRLAGCYWLLLGRGKQR